MILRLKRKHKKDNYTVGALYINEVYFYKAKDYYFIILLSFVFLLLANFLGNALRAIGDSVEEILKTAKTKNGIAIT